ncbi:flavodoxin domain-containing protein [Bacillaceae bacterium C204]|uniref:flavodoxin domain-containing protein n=1 Tax=Neobacillus sp. 204 TaxID=3383351 RepID=UPI0039787826
MKTNCLIVFASMTGNTEEIANLIGKGIEEAGRTVVIKDIFVSGSGKIKINFNESLIQSEEINRNLYKMTLRQFD